MRNSLIFITFLHMLQQTVSFLVFELFSSSCFIMMSVFELISLISFLFFWFDIPNLFSLNILFLFTFLLFHFSWPFCSVSSFMFLTFPNKFSHVLVLLLSSMFVLEIIAVVIFIFILSSGVNHNVTARGWLLPFPSLAGSQTWVSSTTRGRRLTFGDSLYYPIQWVEIKDGATWELIRGLGILDYPSPPCWAYLQLTSFIKRIFSSLRMG